MVRGQSTHKPQLTVLMTVDVVGGVWSYATRLCRALPETRFVLATMGPRLLPAQSDEIAGLENTILIESSYSLEWMRNGSEDFARSCDWLVQLAEHYHA